MRKYVIIPISEYGILKVESGQADKEEKMKLLFVYDCAHVCEDVAAHLTDVKIEFLPLMPTWKLALKIRQSKADIVHANYIHSPAYACLASLKRPYVLMAHGDDVRNGLGYWQKKAIDASAQVFYTTKDLGKYVHGSYIPTPVDLDKFYLRKHEGKKALYFEQNTGAPQTRTGEAQHIEWIRKGCEEHGYELTYRAERNVPYEQMPEYLSQFSLFFDHVFPEHSKTALECMGLGIPVLPEKGIPVEKQYEEVCSVHDSKKVADLLRRHYNYILMNDEEKTNLLEESAF